MSYCRNRLSEPTARITSSPSDERFSAKPGMSKRLHGSTSRRMPSRRSASAAKRRLSTIVTNVWSRAVLADGMPTRQFSCGTFSAFAYSIARPTPSWNSPTRSGRHAIPRSP
jgi:hypothetical protein